MLTSDSVVATALPGGVITAPDAAAVGAGTGPGAGSADLHPIGRSDARPAPSERLPKPRREKSSGRRRYSTMSSKESLSHMRASRRVLWRRNKSSRVRRAGAVDPHRPGPLRYAETPCSPPSRIGPDARLPASPRPDRSGLQRPRRDLAILRAAAAMTYGSSEFTVEVFDGESIRSGRQDRSPCANTTLSIAISTVERGPPIRLRIGTCIA